MEHRCMRTFDEDIVIPYSEVYLVSGGNGYTIGCVTFENDDPTRLLANPFEQPPTVPNALYPVASPDYSQVAYTVLGAGRDEIWIVSAPSGGDEVKLYDATVDAPFIRPVQLCWRPDGTQILWTAVGPSIYVMNPDGSGKATFYTDPSARNIGNIQFNYDASRISFQVLLTATSIGNWVMDSDGTNASQVSTSPTQFSNLYQNFSATPWAKTQNTIAFKGGTLAAPTARKINDDGTGNTLLGSLDIAQGMYMDRWSADDVYLAYIANTRNSLRRFNSDGSGNALIHTAAGSGNDLGGYDSSILIVLDRIYFSNGYISSIKWDGTDFRNHTYAAGVNGARLS